MAKKKPTPLTQHYLLRDNRSSEQVEICKMNKACGSNDTYRNKWQPLSFPSAAIFLPTQGHTGGGGQKNPSIGRRSADPFFPLHRDVLIAAMRELLIMDGHIHPGTMEVMSGRSSNDGKTKEGGAKNVENLDEQTNAAASEGEVLGKRKGTCIEIAPPSSSDDEEQVNDFLSFKKLRTQDASVDSLATLQLQQQPQVFADVSSHPQPHVVPIAVDRRGRNETFDYAQFNSAEALVDHAVKRAMLAIAESSDDNYHTLASEKKSSDAKEVQEVQLITSKRKVSDADDLEESHGNASDFPTSILSLVRSNIMLLQTSSSGTKLSKLTTQSGTEFAPAHSTNHVETDHAIISFLRHPKLQREQQQGKANKKLLVLPRLLEASIEDEYNLRAKAYQVVSSMMNSFPGNDLNISLRTFLGYKTKSPGRDRLLEMVSDVLFDVSHAMYAWIHTEDDIARSQGKDAASKTSSNMMDMQIKASLFDDRALKRIGGFDPSSLLPLALGIYRCRQAELSWAKYAVSRNGRTAMSVHTKQREERPGVEGASVKGETYKSHAGTKQFGTVTDNEALLELGRQRRGRRGKSLFSCQL